jgi:dTDP-4-dehydrorhamnose 3,5-epimerase
MKRIKTKFKNLDICHEQKFNDTRGNLRETFKQSVIRRNIAFSITSKSKKNILRGLHVQTRNTQDKYIIVLKGTVLDVVVDLRKNSKTFGKHFKIVLSENNCKSLFVPKGFAHGFLTLDKENIVHYGCTNYKDIYSEQTILLNDPDLKIKWGIINQ